ncbi:oxidoreductase [Lactococcus hodotermopsidis]|uniref:Oxidoreductase n=1 Tax=Pseudolactococcus hodotermopsidis TaxID=2709157 RepID=A0A6A0BC69_9LACT|nr:Gfo/Idh/MocA family oxidoreductase [Lactococcus hodotermopsidis]GFH42265.1 oxidoreductase [Lactococcus hodotermopsidis]
MTLKLGVIGTGWISRAFIDAALLSKKYDFTAIYTRDLANGVTFTEDFEHVAIFNDLEEFVKTELDVIYIASPNALHFEQAKTAILAGKNVIVEKPAFSNPDEFEAIVQLSIKQHVLFFEAAKHLHEPSCDIIREFLSDKTIIGADFTFAKYSSKMPALLEGDLPNKFNKSFSGGLLADLGVYLLYAAHAFFGKPIYADYTATMLESGVDISGIGVLSYETFKVAIKTGGNYTSYLPNEIYTTDGTLTIDNISTPTLAFFTDLSGNKTPLNLKSQPQNMLEEAQDFAAILDNPNSRENFEHYEEWINIARDVAETSYAMRLKAGIIYDADQK